MNFDNIDYFIAECFLPSFLSGACFFLSVSVFISIIRHACLSFRSYYGNLPFSFFCFNLIVHQACQRWLFSGNLRGIF